MARTKPKSDDVDAFELIELLSDDVRVLARAFEVIAEVCRERDEAGHAGPGAADVVIQ